jgi:hypothetical protein
VSVEAAVLWLFVIPHPNRDELLPGEANELRDECVPVFAVYHQWTEDFIAKLRDELVAAGLWALARDRETGRLLVQVLRQNQNQSGTSWYQKEAPSKFTPQEITPDNSRVVERTPENSESFPGREGKVRETREGKGSVGEEFSPLSSKEDTSKPLAAAVGRVISNVESRKDLDPIKAETQRILCAWNELLERRGLLVLKKPREDRTIRRAVELGTCAGYPGDTLESEFGRVYDMLVEADFQPDLALVINHLGEQWKKRREEPQGGEGRAPEVDAAALRAEYEAIGKGKK